MKKFTGVLIVPALTAAAVFSGGCATAPRDAGFGDVARSVQEHNGAHIEWNRESGRAQIEKTVRKLLEQKLTAGTAVQISLLNNQDLQATISGLGIAEADLVEAGLLKNPLLTGEIRFPGNPLEPYELTLAQDFLSVITIPLRRKVARAQLEEAKLRVTSAVLQLAAQTREDFYGLAGAQQALALRQTLGGAAQAAADLAGKQYAAGNITEFDLASERSAASRTEVEVAESEMEVATVRGRLDRLMGLSAANWEIAPDLPPLPDRELPLAGLEDMALREREDLAAAKMETKAAARAYPLAKFTAIDEAALGLHQERDAAGDRTTGPAISLSIPIFNWGQAARLRARTRYEQSLERLNALAVNVRSQVREQWERLAAVRRLALDYQKNLVPLNRRLVALAQTQYDSMGIGVFQLLETKQNEIRTEAGSIAARRDYWITRAQLEQAVGGRLPDEGEKQ